MPVANSSIHLPDYQTFVDAISVLSLPFSCSELHGMMCGYLCANAVSKGESYLHALTLSKKNEANRAAALALFEVYTISQHQLAQFDFTFQLLLPAEHESLANRARAFGEWCEGFTRATAEAGIFAEHLQEEESQDALLHLQEFAQLDYESLQVDEEDEKALMEVSEYARMAVLRLYNELFAADKPNTSGKIKH